MFPPFRLLNTCSYRYYMYLKSQINRLLYMLTNKNLFLLSKYTVYTNLEAHSFNVIFQNIIQEIKFYSTICLKNTIRLNRLFMHTLFLVLLKMHYMYSGLKFSRDRFSGLKEINYKYKLQYISIFIFNLSMNYTNYRNFASNISNKFDMNIFNQFRCFFLYFTTWECQGCIWFFSLLCTFLSNRKACLKICRSILLELSLYPL